MSRPRYVTVGEGREPTLHRLPAFEECNLDDAKIGNRFRTLAQVTFPVHPCGHCKPYEVDESTEPEDGKPVSDAVEPKGRKATP